MSIYCITGQRVLVDKRNDVNLNVIANFLKSSDSGVISVSKQTSGLYLQMAGVLFNFSVDRKGAVAGTQSRVQLKRIFLKNLFY